MTRRTGVDVLVVGDVDSVHVRRVVGGMVEAGLRVAVAGFGVREIAGSRTYDLGWSTASPSDAQFGVAIPRLARVIRKVRPAIINPHYLSSYGLMAVLAVRLASPLRSRPRVVQTVWGTDLLVTSRASRVQRAMARFALCQAQLVTGDSDDLESEALALAPEVPFHRFVFGPPASLLAQPRSSESVVISARRLDPDTRVPLVVEAFRHAHELDPASMHGWRLVVAGSGTDAAKVRTATGGDQRIELTGPLQQDDLYRRFGTAAVSVSIPVSDATSAALLEAMAAGVVPIVNDLPANREWVDDAVGIMVSRDPTPKELAHAIIAATRRPEATRALRARVATVTWEAEMAGLVERMRPMMEGRRG
jgi:glycosyltransferase involved in cell wall biosynthesis